MLSEKAEAWRKLRKPEIHHSVTTKKSIIYDHILFEYGEKEYMLLSNPKDRSETLFSLPEKELLIVRNQYGATYKACENLKDEDIQVISDIIHTGAKNIKEFPKYTEFDNFYLDSFVSRTKDLISEMIF